MKQYAAIIRNILAVLTGFAVIGMLIIRHTELGHYSKLVAMTASTGFVLTGLFNFAKYTSRYNLLIFIGLIFCWFGDYLSGFSATVIAFLLAHLGFISAFLDYGIDKTRSLKITPVVLILGVIIYYWLYPYVPAFDLAFLIGYIVVISIMVIFAFGIRPFKILIPVAAVLFLVSDIFVARWRFVDTSSINAFFCYPLYYASCVMFAFSKK